MLNVKEQALLTLNFFVPNALAHLTSVAYQEPRMF